MIDLKKDLERSHIITVRLCIYHVRYRSLYVDACYGLVTNYGEGGGGATKREGGGHVKFYPYEKGGGRKKF